MTELRNHRRMASEILKCGESRVWIDPDRTEEVATAVTREDIKKLIDRGIIEKRSVKGTSRARARAIEKQKDKGKRKGYGSRKGSKNARYARKASWISRIRAIRRYLRELRDSGIIDRKTYRLFYRRASGGSFRSVSHLKTHLRMAGIDLKEEEGGKDGA